MFRLTRPSGEELKDFLSSQKDSPFSYPDVGASAAGRLPRGYCVDRNSIQLGHGEGKWQHAVEAVRRWQMFNIPWIRLHPPTAAIETRTEIAVLVKHFGFYSLNACRIAYVVDEDSIIKRFGFAYGTLADHAESGEERFTVEWNQSNDTVWYDIVAFSRPRHILARFGYPLSRFLQKRFAEDSKVAMVQAVIHTSVGRG